MGRPVPSLDEAALDPVRMLGPMRALTRKAPAAATWMGVRAVAVEPLDRRLLRYRVELNAPRPHWSVIGKVYETNIAGQRAFDEAARTPDPAEHVLRCPHRPEHDAPGHDVNRPTKISSHRTGFDFRSWVPHY